MIHTLLIEKLFETPEQKERGLMYDFDPLRPNTCALFVFDPPQTVNVWMKDTPCALDIVFIREDMTIDSIHIGAMPYDTTNIQSQSFVKYMAETLTGYCRMNNIRPGDRVTFQSADPVM